MFSLHQRLQPVIPQLSLSSLVQHVTFWSGSNVLRVYHTDRSIFDFFFGHKDINIGSVFFHEGIWQQINIKSKNE